MENLQTSNEKQYYIPMEVTSETIRDFGINPTDAIWTSIGHRRVRALMVPVTKEQYYEFMRPIWREEKRRQRHGDDISLDQLYEDADYEVRDDYDVEENCMKKLLIDELHKALDELEEVDRVIMKMFGNGNSENEIGKVVGMSQRGVNKRKLKALQKLRSRLKDYL